LERCEFIVILFSLIKFEVLIYSKLGPSSLSWLSYFWIWVLTASIYLFFTRAASVCSFSLCIFINKCLPSSTFRSCSCLSSTQFLKFIPHIHLLSGSLLFGIFSSLLLLCSRVRQTKWNYLYHYLELSVFLEQSFFFWVSSWWNLFRSNIIDLMSLGLFVLWDALPDFNSWGLLLGMHSRLAIASKTNLQLFKSAKELFSLLLSVSSLSCELLKKCVEAMIVHEFWFNLNKFSSITNS